MHVRHELQPVLNLKHQRRERAVQPFRLVELLQRLPVLASARVRDVVRVGGGGRVGRRVSAERGLEAVLAHAPDEERHRMPRVSPAVRRPMRVGGGVLTMKSMIQRAREMRLGAAEKSHERHSPRARTERRCVRREATDPRGREGCPTSATVRIHASTPRRASHGRRASSREIPSLPRPRESVSEPNTRYVTHPPSTLSPEPLQQARW